MAKAATPKVSGTPPAEIAPAPAPSSAPTRATANTKLFWTLMESWSVPDEAALKLIGFPGKLGRSGKRPRFRLNTSQIGTLAYLQEIDGAVRALYGEPRHWLHRRQNGIPMAGRTPLEAMIEDRKAALPSLLQALTRAAMRQALRKTRR